MNRNASLKKVNLWFMDCKGIIASVFAYHNRSRGAFARLLNVVSYL